MISCDIINSVNFVTYIRSCFMFPQNGAQGISTSGFVKAATDGRVPILGVISNIKVGRMAKITKSVQFC